MTSTHPAIQQLLLLLDEAFQRKSWHGTNLRGSIRGLTLDESLWRPGEERHNIRELVVHAAYWKYSVRRRITGEARGSFPIEGSNWFERTGGEKEWKADVVLLVAEHRKLRQAVETLRPRQLEEVPAGSKFTYGGLIRGAAAHDLYHCGQIQFLKRLRNEK